MEYDVYIESVFFSLYRNWNLEPTLKVGGIVIFGQLTGCDFISTMGDENRIRTHINSNTYTGIEEITRYTVKYPEDLILNFKEFENRIGYKFTVFTKNMIREITASEAIWFIDKKIKIETAPL